MNLTFVKAFYFAIQARFGSLISSEPEFHEVSRLVSSGDTVIDVGSNIGRYSLRLSSLVGNEGIVFSVDPSTSMGWIQSIIMCFNGRENVRFINYGLSSTSGMGKFLVDKRKPKGAIFSTFTGSRCSSSLKDGVSVYISTLDILFKDLPQVSLIKIDAEGEESLILQGGARLISEHKPIIIIENNGSDEIDRLISLWGYSKVILSQSSRNIIWMPPDSNKKVILESNESVC